MTPGAHFEQGLAQQRTQTRYGSASEASRAGLRQALKDGEESGRADYSLEGLMKELDHESAALRPGLEKGRGQWEKE